MALDGKLREARCLSISHIPDFIVKLDGMWVEFESLGDPRSDYVQKAAILFGIRDALPNLFDQLASRRGIDYNEIKRSLIPSNAYSEAGAGRSEESNILQSRAGESVRRCSKAWADQCVYRLKKNHRWRECRRYSSGKPPVQRGNGMLPARTFPLSQRNNKPSEETTGQSFFAFNITVDKDGNMVSFLLNSRLNVHMTPHLNDLSEGKSISKKCTFGNSSHLQATVSGVIKLLVQEKGKAVEVRIKDVLWVLELPSQLLSTGPIRRHGGEFVDSGIGRSHIVLRKGGPKIHWMKRMGWRRYRGRPNGTMETEWCMRRLLGSGPDYY